MFAEKHPLILAYEKSVREYKRIQAGPEPIEQAPRTVWQNAVFSALQDMGRAAAACDDAKLPIEKLAPELR
jgi:hypothetical protein